MKLPQCLLNQFSFTLLHISAMREVFLLKTDGAVWDGRTGMLRRLVRLAGPAGKPVRHQVGVHGGNHEALHKILEFAHVSGPFVSQELLNYTLREHLNARIFLTEMLQIKKGKGKDVLLPFTQGRYLHRHHTDSVIQVGAEASVEHHLLQILVGGAQQAEINRICLCGAQSLYLPALQNSEQLSLQSQGHGVDFIQKQGAAVGQLDHPRLALSAGACESTLFIPEQLGL
ncbi:hypothetical protein SDC9_124986 [bioreactor metagenome]|uniref:Uncharacterized protein n=1 Tax=bioreactor metagenome TaxID=1076179 RepID=A0A645CLT0_9ZZZZ